MICFQAVHFRRLLCLCSRQQNRSFFIDMAVSVFFFFFQTKLWTLSSFDTLPLQLITIAFPPLVYCLLFFEATAHSAPQDNNAKLQHKSDSINIIVCLSRLHPNLFFFNFSVLTAYVTPVHVSYDPTTALLCWHGSCLTTNLPETKTVYIYIWWNAW